MSQRIRRFIFVNRYFYPDLSATSKMLTDLAFYLSGEGMEIHVVTSRQIYDNPKAHLTAFEEVSGVRIHRVWTTCFGRANLILRFIDYLTFYGSAYWVLMFLSGRGDTIIAKTDPPLLSVAAAEAAFFRRARLVNWLQDLFPETAIKLNVTLVKFFAPLLKVLRNLSLKSAFLNVVISQAMGEKLKSEGVAASKITVIQNWADGQKIKPVEHRNNPLRKEWGLENKFVVGYSGNMGRAHEFQTILGAAERLRNRSEIVFLFIGAGRHRDFLFDEAQKRNLSNILFKPFQPEENLNESVGVSDAQLVTLEPRLEGLVVPSKFYTALAAARPVIYIGDPQAEMAVILKKNSCGSVVWAGQAESLAELICQWQESRDIVEVMGQNARRVFEALFDKKYALLSWKKILS